jgi:acylglycerol lipase
MGRLESVRLRLKILPVFLALALSACAPLVQQALAPPVAFSGPHYTDDALVSFDGARLGLSTWKAEGEPWAVVIGLHGMNDYARTFEMAGPYWAARGVTTYAYDARGFGRSPNRGVWAGETLMIEDLRAAVTAARAAHPGAIVAVVGESMGAAEAMVAFGGDDPPAADRVILCSPAVWGWAAQPVVYTLPLWVSAHTAGGKKVSPPSGLKILPSDNIPMLRAISSDPLMVFRTRLDAIYGLVRLMDHAAEAGARLKVPTAFLYGAHDEIIPKRAALAAARRLPAGTRTVLYPQNYHMMLRDLNARIVWEDVLAFLKAPDSNLPSGAPPLVPLSRTLTSSR